MAGDQELRKLIGELGRWESWVRRTACVKLGTLADGRAVEPLIRALGDYDADVRGAARKALVAIGVQAVPALINSLKSKNQQARKAACEALGRIADPEAVRPLVKRLADGHPPVRRVACLALGLIGDKQAIDSLIGSLGDAYMPARRAACKALGALNDRQAVKPLIGRLNDPDSGVRRAACEALGQIGDPRALDSLVQRLGDSGREVRIAACKALGGIADPGAVEPLIQVLGDSDFSVRGVALDALSRLGEGRLAEAIIGVFAGKEHAVRTLCAFAARGDLRMVDPLVRRLDDVWDPARGSVCRALQVIWETVGPEMSGALCRRCRQRFERKTKKLGILHRAEYYVCRSCGKAGNAVLNIREVVVALDSRGNAKPVWRDGVVKANWLKERRLFDFDSVEIVNATDDDVMRFCVQVGNDTDDFRRKRYKSLPVRIHPECRLEENTLRNLRALFGKVSEGAL